MTCIIPLLSGVRYADFTSTVLIWCWWYHDCWLFMEIKIYDRLSTGGIHLTRKDWLKNLDKHQSLVQSVKFWVTVCHRVIHGVSLKILEIFYFPTSPFKVFKASVITIWVQINPISHLGILLAITYKVAKNELKLGLDSEQRKKKINKSYSGTLSSTLWWLIRF